MSEVKAITGFASDNSVPDAEELAWAFPEIDPGLKPLGSRVLVQLRRTKKTATKSKIILVEETREAEKWNGQIAKVISFGPLAFKNRETMEPWPEGTWVSLGDYVRVPKWGGDRWERLLDGEENENDPVLFMILNDHEVISAVTSNPLSFKAFV